MSGMPLTQLNMHVGSLTQHSEWLDANLSCSVMEHCAHVPRQPIRLLQCKHA